MSDTKKKIAFWFRYGPAEHTELCHAIPEIIQDLSKHCEIHYFGMKSSKSVPEKIASHCVIHNLPLRVNRASLRDKTFKTLLWYLFIPYMAIKCRVMGVKVIYIDETLPLLVFITRMFYRKAIAMTVADFFIDVYLERFSIMSPFRKLIKAIDYSSWKKLATIYTKTESAKSFLATKGIDKQNIYRVPDPCDSSIYHPLEKKLAKEQHGFDSSDVVLVHHGILHPNKGNDLIIRAIAEIKDTIPNIFYLLVGSGPDEPRLKALVEELNLKQNVIFTGWLPKPSDVNIALNAGDIGLVMRVGQESDDFHVTGALVHNMACGLPILAANLAGIAEIITDDKSGLLFDPRNMTDFKDKLTILANDSILRDNLGSASLRLSKEHFDMKKYTDQTVAPILKLLFNI